MIAVRAFSRDCARKKGLRSRQGANGLFRYDKHVGLSFWIAVQCIVVRPATGWLGRAQCAGNATNGRSRLAKATHEGRGRSGGGAGRATGGFYFRKQLTRRGR